MASAGLQRSTETFRRSGSSGLVWENRFLPGETKHQQQQEEEEEETMNKKKGEKGADARMEEGPVPVYRTGRVSPALDPPSPRLSGCGFCGIFGKKPAGPPDHNSKPNNLRHR